ncbi:MAG: DUF2283 domain-containing protein [Chitinophagaceae bacterium]|jgi:uncharacterized protein YuzE|nr:DUF2283 domain-containing protein [Chitinophagaceae bacterium]
MKVHYDKETDILYIQLSDSPVMESDEDKKGVILDYGKNNQLVGIEILNASSTTISPTKVEYEVA